MITSRELLSEGTGWADDPRHETMTINEPGCRNMIPPNPPLISCKSNATFALKHSPLISCKLNAIFADLHSRSCTQTFQHALMVPLLSVQSVPYRFLAGDLRRRSTLEYCLMQVLWVDVHSGLKTLRTDLTMDRGLSFEVARAKLTRERVPGDRGSSFRRSRQPMFGRSMFLLALQKPDSPNLFSICRPNTGVSYFDMEVWSCPAASPSPSLSPSPSPPDLTAR